MIIQEHPEVLRVDVAAGSWEHRVPLEYIIHGLRTIKAHPCAPRPGGRDGLEDDIHGELATGARGGVARTCAERATDMESKRRQTTARNHDEWRLR